MKYDINEIASRALWGWEGSDYLVLSYPPKRRKTIVTDFILAFKNNDNNAVAIATELILTAVRNIERKMVIDGEHWYIVSIPPSAAGRSNEPCEQVCKAVERHSTWIQHLPDALQRTKSVRKSAYAAPGQRPAHDDHIKSIEYEATIRDKDASFIMLDDVITQGSVSGACREILMAKTACRQVIGVFLGRTE